MKDREDKMLDAQLQNVYCILNDDTDVYWFLLKGNSPFFKV